MARRIRLDDMLGALRAQHPSQKSASQWEVAQTSARFGAGKKDAGLDDLLAALRAQHPQQGERKLAARIAGPGLSAAQIHRNNQPYRDAMRRRRQGPYVSGHQRLWS